MKNVLMILLVVAVLVLNGCAAVQKQVVQENISSTAPAPKVEKKGGLIINESCATDHKEGEKIFIEVNCGRNKIINIVVNLRPNTEYFVLIGGAPFVMKKSTADGYIIFENTFAENVIIIPEMSDEEMSKVKASPFLIRPVIDKLYPAHKATDDKGGE